jgi:hypothetical protein
MTLTRLHCNRSEIKHVRRFVEYAKRLVNEASYYPPYDGYGYMVALALYSEQRPTGKEE